MTTRPQVLIADDEQDILDIFAIIASRMPLSYDVVPALGFHAAQDVLARGAVAGMLTDLRMPGGNGLDLIRQARVCHPQIKLFVLSGYAEVSDSQLQELGVLQRFIKPCNFNDVLLQVEAAISGRQRDTVPTPPAGLIPQADGGTTARS